MELKSIEDQDEFAELKLRELLVHPDDVEKEDAKNQVAETTTALVAAEEDLRLFRPLIEKGFGSRQDLATKTSAVEKSKIERTHSELRARIILAGALPYDRDGAKLDREFAQQGVDAKKLDNQDQINALTLAVQLAERKVRAAQRLLNRNKEILAQSTLRAPHEGVIVYRTASYRSYKKPEVGERVSPWIAPIDLPNYEKMKVRTQVPESLVRKIKARVVDQDGKQISPGSHARVVVQTLPWLTFTGQVVWIDGWARDRNSKLSDADIKAQGLSGVKVFDVEVELDACDPKHLREGFRASVDFPEETLKDVIAVPITAVNTLDGISYVTVYNLGWPETRKVTLGTASGGKVVIAAGLSAGESVFVPRQSERKKDELDDSDDAKNKAKSAQSKKQGGSGHGAAAPQSGPQAAPKAPSIGGAGEGGKRER
jgi:multidrug resistance efflux pump